MTAVVRLGSWDELGVAAYAIRHQVFVLEQGVPVELELDEHDATALHALLSVGDVPIATGRLLADGHLGRIAVLEAHRRHGHGQRLMQALIDIARQRGYGELILHAQMRAQAFYAGLGFCPMGAAFMEAGIPHIGMRLQLA
ncbi:MAG TPA: GNAT family N-acetyltransferase [Rhodocyclaceae bacterium]|nr:GNAT family N-acetyltransferase [Rhodocyclaceae bacterium]